MEKEPERKKEIKIGKCERRWGKRHSEDNFIALSKLFQMYLSSINFKKDAELKLYAGTHLR